MNVNAWGRTICQACINRTGNHITPERIERTILDIWDSMN
jgi:hypothetical protein